MSTTIEVPITVLGGGVAGVDGTALCVINPSSIFNSSAFIANQNYLPFVSVASGSTEFPFNVGPAFTATAFNTQAANASTFAIDSLQIDFIETESPLNVKGKLTTAFFYEPPNQTWNVGVTGVYNTAAIRITDAELANDVGYVMRRSNAECTKLTRLGTMIL